MFAAEPPAEGADCSCHHGEFDPVAGALPELRNQDQLPQGSKGKPCHESEQPVDRRA